MRFLPKRFNTGESVTPVATSSASKFSGQKHRGISLLCEIRLMIFLERSSQLLMH
jgi:hypothetical protein